MAGGGVPVDGSLRASHRGDAAGGRVLRRLAAGLALVLDASAVRPWQAPQVKCSSLGQQGGALSPCEEGTVPDSYTVANLGRPAPGPRGPTSDKKAALHAARVSELDGLASPPSLLLYGDSITEQFRETCVGHPCYGGSNGLILEPEGDRKVLSALSQRYGDARVMAVAGDTTQELLWRLRNGEAPRGRPRAVLLHIGINDFSMNASAMAACWLNPATTLLARGWRRAGAGPGPASYGSCSKAEGEFGRADAERVFLGIQAVVEELWRRCRVPIVLTMLFPTGYRWPAGAYGRTVPVVNGLLQQLGQLRAVELHVVDCSWAVLDPVTGRIDPAMQPDYLHPSLRGMRRWAECLQPVLDRVIGARPAWG